MKEASFAFCLPSQCKWLARLRHDQPRGRRLRSRRHILLTISPSTAASHPVDLESQCLRQYAERVITSRACHEIAREPPPCLLYASCNANPTARSSFANLPAAMSLPTQYSLIPGEKRRLYIRSWEGQGQEQDCGQGWVEEDTVLREAGRSGWA